MIIKPFLLETAFFIPIPMILILLYNFFERHLTNVFMFQK